MQGFLRLMCGLVAVVVVVGAASAQATRPAGAATAAANSPKEALIGLAKAMETADVPTLRTLLHAEGEQETKLLEQLLSLAAAQRDVRKAAEARFGRDTGDLTAGPKADATITAIETAIVNDSGNEARVRVDGGEMVVKRIDGQWKVPMSNVAQGASFDFERRMTDVKRMVEIFRQGAADIQAGKYRSDDDAADALRVKLRAAATQPVTTQPAAGPTTQK